MQWLIVNVVLIVYSFTAAYRQLSILHNYSFPGFFPSSCFSGCTTLVLLCSY